VKKEFKERMLPSIEEKSQELDDDIEKLKFSKPDGWEHQIKAIKHLKKVLGDWRLDLDTVGFLSINGSIRDA